MVGLVDGGGGERHFERGAEDSIIESVIETEANETEGEAVQTARCFEQSQIDGRRDGAKSYSNEME